MDVTNTKRAILLLFVIINISACTNRSNQTKNSSNPYEYAVESNLRLAEDYRTRGIEFMAEFHEEEAEKARHNQYAHDCDIIDYIIFDILFNGDKCSRK